MKKINIVVFGDNLKGVDSFFSRNKLACAIDKIRRVHRKYTSKSILLIICLILIPVSILLAKGFYFVAARYYASRGFSKQVSKDYKGAIIYYSKALRYDNKNSTLLISRGSAHLDLRKYYNAIEDYSRAIKLVPNDPRPYAYRARAYYELKDAGKSIIDFNKAISLDSRFGYAFRNRGLLRYSLMADPSGGCEDFKTAFDLGVEDAEELLLSGHCRE